MRASRTAIPDVWVLEPQVFADARGHFFESFNRGRFEAAVGRPVDFVQDNQSLSVRGVLRGLHYQLPRPQAKLVRVARGEVFDVAVDLRRGSPTFRRWVGEVLSARNRRQLWIPEGFAHGFLVLSDEAELLYKTTDYWHPEHERCIRWDDPQLAIAWPSVGGPPVLGARDAAAGSLAEAVVFEGPAGAGKDLP
jgi:dTDP-4-dehydrorhamnose 3,5-epimerase